LTGSDSVNKWNLWIACPAPASRTYLVGGGRRNAPTGRAREEKRKSHVFITQRGAEPVRGISRVSSMSEQAAGAPRADMIQSAVTFLGDPKVQDSPMSQRISFLESKGLTSHEIDVALGQAGHGGAPMVRPGAAYPMMPAYPPIQSRRDWRDWFIMAVVSGTVGYGLIALARVRGGSMQTNHSATCCRICSRQVRACWKQSGTPLQPSTTKLRRTFSSWMRRRRP